MNDVTIMEDAICKLAENLDGLLDPVPFHYSKAFMYFVKGCINDAEREFSAVLKLEDGQIDAMQGLAAICAIKGNRKEALNILETLHAKTSGNNLRVILSLVENYISIGNLEKARALCLEGIKRLNDKKDIYMLYHAAGMIHDRMKQYDMAITFYNEAIKRLPNGAIFYERGVLLNLANAQRKLTRIDDAINTLQRALTLGGYRKARIWRELGSLYAIKGERKTAIEMLLKSIEFDPNDPKAHHNLGLMYLAEGENDLAKNEFAKENSLKKGGVKL